jgi:hypothetical protein
MKRFLILATVLLVPLAVFSDQADESTKGPNPFGNGPDARAAGGPDDFGYWFLDSNEAGGPTYGYVDISATGATAIVGYSDDSVAGPLPIGFTFNFYGVDYTDFWVQTNGTIGFSSFSYDYTNQCLPTTDLNGNLLAPLWDDLVLGSGPPGTIFYETMGTAPNRYLVIQFHEVRYIAGIDDDTIEFEVILYEGTNDIVYQYADLTNAASSNNGGVSATIGIQGDSAASPAYFLEYACNPSTPLAPPLAVRFFNQQPTPTPTPVPDAIPTMTSSGLVILLLAMVGVAFLVLRNRN